MGIEYVDLLTNGQKALELSMQVLNIVAEVITTLFALSMHAIVRNQWIPVFCEINADDFTMDVFTMEALVTDTTSEIVPDSRL